MPTNTLADQFADQIRELDPHHEHYAVDVVNRLLDLARKSGASDVHLLPDTGGRTLQVLFRNDGVLHSLGSLTSATHNIVSRLKVVANLLTYRTDVPQEGRIRADDHSVEMRVSTFPTVHGEKAVIRLFVGSGEFRFLHELGLPDEIRENLETLLTSTTGLFLVCGPAGSGKTTTLYAALRHIQRHSQFPRSICTLEDPVEAVLPGISQSQVNPEGEFTYQRGLPSLMRQDPDVIMVGEIRNPETAEVVFQASLTGHLVLTSFHAGGAADAVSRLSDMGIEPYVLRSGLKVILSQRLMRRACGCRVQGEEGCEACRHTGYLGRMIIVEVLHPDLKGLGRAILNKDDAERIQELAVESGMTTLTKRAREAVDRGWTTEEEFHRVFGLVGV